MKRTYAYRLFPRRRERAALARLRAEHREVYNAALQQCKVVYETTGKHIGGLEQWAYLREWRKQAGILSNASSVQHTLRRLDKAYAALFRRVKAGETPGHPRFKSESRLSSLEYTYGDGCKLNYDAAFDRFVLYVQHVGEIKVKLHRFVPHTANLKHVVLKRKASGWYVYLMLDLPDALPAEPNGLPAVGGDMGLLRLLTLSDGTEIDNPRWMRQALADLRVAQRRLARRTKGSQGRKDARQIVARLHEHVANVRRDFWHKVTLWLVSTYGLIVLEQLDLAFMTRNGRLALSAHDAGLGLFQTLLSYKAVEAGSHVTLVNPRNTSQACSECGALVEKDLSVRVHSCPHCHLAIDRDVNAARNILKRAFSPPGSGGQALT